MNTPLAVEVSCFPNYESTAPKPVKLVSWLTSDKYKVEVELIRQEPDKSRRDEMKAKLPCITPSGQFTQRNSRSLTQHSGFIAFDIDLKDNESIQNYHGLKEQLCNIQNVAYAGLSVSGTGLWGLIPIAHPEKHTQHFLALQKSFSKLGINIDSSCKDVSRLRGYSYDPDAYFNYNAKPFTALYVPPKPKRTTYKATGEDDKAKVEKAINSIFFDIAPDYKTWFEIGCSLATFGEDGREYFHAISQYHPNYSVSETDRQFSHCLKKSYNFTLGTFFYQCKNAGVELEEVFTKKAKENLDRNQYSSRRKSTESKTIETIQEYDFAGTPIGPKGYPVSWDIQTPLQKITAKNPVVAELIKRLDLIQ